jgi:hypothetical protein
MHCILLKINSLLTSVPENKYLKKETLSMPVTVDITGKCGTY